MAPAGAFFLRTTASSPLNSRSELVMSASARIAASASGWATIKTSPAATVPAREMMVLGVALPLTYSSILY